MAVAFLFRGVPELAAQLDLKRDRDPEKDEAYMTAYAIAAVRQELPAISVPSPVKTVGVVFACASVVYWPKLQIVRDYAEAAKARSPKAPAQVLPVRPQAPQAETVTRAEPAPVPAREFNFLHGAPDGGKIKLPEA